LGTGSFGPVSLCEKYYIFHVLIESSKSDFQLLKVSVQNLSKTRAYDEIFSDVSFTLNSGELLWLKGANGSGKTTLMRILAGLSEASSGEVCKESDSLHYISHQMNLIDSLSVKETTEQLFPLYGFENSLALSEALLTVGLAGTETLRVSQLSAGQKQRLNLLILCLDQRPLWLLDEPYSNLDTHGRAWLNALIKEHLVNKGMVVIVTHADSLELDASKVVALDA